MEFKKENYYWYLYILGIFVSIIPWLIDFISDLDKLTFFNKEPDLMFYLYIFIIPIGIYAMFRLTQYYLLTRATNYLLLSYVIFGSGVSFFLFSIRGYIIEGQGGAASYPYLMFGRATYFMSIIVFIIYAAKSQEWNNYNIIAKSILIILLVEASATLLHELIHDLLITFDSSNFGERFSPDYNPPWYLKLTLTYQFLGWDYSDIAPLLAPIALLVSYLTMKTYQNISEIKLSRILWILIGFVQLIVYTALLLSYRSSNADVADFFYGFEEKLFYSTAVSLTLLVISLMLIILPEAALISNYQISKACKLYVYVQASEPVKKKEFWGFARLREYVENIPEDIYLDTCMD